MVYMIMIIMIMIAVSVLIGFAALCLVGSFIPDNDTLTLTQSRTTLNV